MAQRWCLSAGLGNLSGCFEGVSLTHRAAQVSLARAGLFRWLGGGISRWHACARLVFSPTTSLSSLSTGQRSLPRAKAAQHSCKSLFLAVVFIGFHEIRSTFVNSTNTHEQQAGGRRCEHATCTTGANVHAEFIVHDFMNEHRTNTACYRKFTSRHRSANKQTKTGVFVHVRSLSVCLSTRTGDTGKFREMKKERRKVIMCKAKN